jgi:hypothetical protein
MYDFSEGALPTEAIQSKEDYSNKGEKSYSTQAMKF